jgi:hypothetical protein
LREGHCGELRKQNPWNQRNPQDYGPDALAVAVGIVRSRTQATEFCFVCLFLVGEEISLLSGGRKVGVGVQTGTRDFALHHSVKFYDPKRGMFSMG